VPPSSASESKTGKQPGSDTQADGVQYIPMKCHYMVPHPEGSDVTAVDPRSDSVTLDTIVIHPAVLIEGYT
jgi:hypothetical protein